jgi:hypothetical protein
LVNQFQRRRLLEIDLLEARIAYDGHVCKRIGTKCATCIVDLPDASYQDYLHFAKRFQRRRLKCENVTDDRRRPPSDEKIRVIIKLPNSEQSYKGKVKTHKYLNRQNQSTTGKL